MSRCLVFSLLLLGILLTVHDAKSEFMDVDDPKLLAIREHVLKAYYLRPDPVNQCNKERHRASVKIYTAPVPLEEQENMLLEMQRSLINSEENYFMGLPETIAAVASTKIQYLLFWEDLMINSATYRNPLSGRTLTLHSLYSPSTVIALNYTEPKTGCFFELIDCYPFAKWLAKYYKGLVSRPIRLQRSEGNSTAIRNMFLRASDGIGGKFTERLLFGANKWLDDVYRDSTIRTTLLVNGYYQDDSTTTAEPAVNDDSYIPYPYLTASEDTPAFTCSPFLRSMSAVMGHSISLVLFAVCSVIYYYDRNGGW